MVARISVLWGGGRGGGGEGGMAGLIGWMDDWLLEGWLDCLATLMTHQQAGPIERRAKVSQVHKICSWSL